MEEWIVRCDLLSWLLVLLLLWVLKYFNGRFIWVHWYFLIPTFWWFNCVLLIKLRKFFVSKLCDLWFIRNLRWVFINNDSIRMVQNQTIQRESWLLNVTILIYRVNFIYSSLFTIYSLVVSLLKSDSNMSSVPRLCVSILIHKSVRECVDLSLRYLHSLRKYDPLDPSFTRRFSGCALVH